MNQVERRSALHPGLPGGERDSDGDLAINLNGQMAGITL